MKCGGVLLSGGLSHDRTWCKSEGVCNSCRMTGTTVLVGIVHSMTALPQWRVVSDDTRCQQWTRCQTRANV